MRGLLHEFSETANAIGLLSIRGLLHEFSETANAIGLLPIRGLLHGFSETANAIGLLPNGRIGLLPTSWWGSDVVLIPDCADLVVGFLQ